MIDETDIAIWQGRLDINRLKKKELTRRYKSLMQQLILLSNSNTQICLWLQTHHSEAWEELLNHDFNTGQPQTEALDKVSESE